MRAFNPPLITNRRELLIQSLKLGIAIPALSCASPLFANQRDSQLESNQKYYNTPKAKAVIQIWMWGGPAQIDTFDPKPDAPYDFTGPLKEAISTEADGVQLNASLPLLAKHAKMFSILRSVTHGNNSHETASYMVQTGNLPGGSLVFPSAGAVVANHAYQNNYKSLLPPYVILTKSQGRFSESGFLGSKMKPFVTGGDPSKPIFEVEGVVSKNVNKERQVSRRELLQFIDTFGNEEKAHKHFADVSRQQEEAYELILGSTGEVFDLSKEPEELKERYGKNSFGQSCLVARRLVERGVKHVTINYNGWDTHKGHFEIMKKKLPEMDMGFSNLLEDLDQRGLLESTVVWWGGEFGRTPKIEWLAPWNGGRSHYGKVFSSVLAGGGFKGGQVIGKTDKTASEAIERPITPAQVLASIYTQLGINPGGKLTHPNGEQITMLPGKYPDELLKEIM